MKPLILVLCLAASASAADWPQWRGPQWTGSSPDQGLPSKWSATENVAWSVDLPGHSAATPIVSGDTVYVTAPEGEGVQLLSLDRRDGKVRWKKTLGPAAGHAHRKHNMSSPSPVTDGRNVYAMTGSGVLKAFAADGRELWTRDFPAEYGAFGLNWGYASSPLLLDGVLFVPVLHGMKTDAPSYVVAVDATSGKNRWKVDRPTPAVQEAPDAYTTPTFVKAPGGTEIVVTGGDVVTGHDPATGKELWRSSGLNPTGDPWYRIVASPLAVDGLVIAPTRRKPMLAIKGGGRGDVTTSHRVWSYDAGPDVPTPATDGTLLYVLDDKGLVSCLDVKTGQVLYGPQRIAVGTYSASPVVADGKVYAVSEDGLTTVLKAGPKFEVLGENALGDTTLATPAVAGGQLFIRTAKKLFCLGARKAAGTYSQLSR
jgi:outer membrane protein assembly factor BamB